MRDGWTETTLGEVAEWYSGGTPRAGKAEFYADGTIPWVVIADMMKTEIFDTASKITAAGLAEIGGRLAPKGSVLISMYATVGRPGYAHLPVATNQAIAWSIPDAKVIASRFLLLVAQYLEPMISSMARGATQRNINRAMLREFSFNLPPLAEQKRIVDVVSSVDVYIDALQQQADSARTARDAVLTSLLEQIYPMSIVYSLKDIAVERGLIGGPFGSSLVSKDYQPSGVPVIRGKNLSSMSGLVEGPYVYVSEQKARELSRNLAVPGDLVVTQRGTLGQIAQVPSGVFESYVISQSQMRFRPNPELATKEFLYLQMSRRDFINEILSREVSTANPHINLGIFSELELKLPSIAEQARIVEIVSSMDGVIQSTEKAVADAKNLRSGLLSDLLSGEHEIPASYNRLLKVA